MSIPGLLASTRTVLALGGQYSDTGILAMYAPPAPPPVGQLTRDKGESYRLKDKKKAGVIAPKPPAKEGT